MVLESTSTLVAVTCPGMAHHSVGRGLESGRARIGIGGDVPRQHGRWYRAASAQWHGTV